MVHFDIPWSLMVFQQRNGRIDRYGQEQTPLIYYLMTEVENEAFKDDNRILEILIEKDEQAIKNIGDPSVFMGVFDTELEENITGQAFEQGFSSETNPINDDPQQQLAETTRLFTSDYNYLAKGIQRIAEREQRDRITQLETDDKKQRIAFMHS